MTEFRVASSALVAPLKEKGDLAELRVAADLAARGCRLAIPFGENCDYDLIADTGDRLHRVQVKYATSDGRIIPVRCASHSLTNGKVKRTKRYTSETIDWIAVYDSASARCYYVPAVELGTGRRELSLRLVPTKNSQRRGVHFADDYTDFPVPRMSPLDGVEPAGLEPAPSALQTPRSSN